LAQSAKHRDALLKSSARLFRRQGYSGTGLKQILEDSGAPKGSLYHYYPGGKEDIGVAVVKVAGRVVGKTLGVLATKSESPSAFILAYAGMLAGWMKGSEFRDGCPITTVLLEMAPESELITQAGQQVMESWIDIMSEVFISHGWDSLAAERAANLSMSSLEGALILARVKQSSSPILDAAEELARLWGRGESS